MYIYGKNVAYEKLKTDTKIHKVYLSKNFNDKELLSLLKSRNIRPNYVDNKVLDHKVEGLHQGIIL